MGFFKNIISADSSKKSKTQSEFSPISHFLAEHQQKKIAFIFGVSCLIFAIIAQILTVKNMTKEEKVFVIDGTNTLHIGPLEILGDQSSIFTTIALTATQVVFQRSPIGLDLSELMTHLFKDEAIKKLNHEISEQIGELKARNLHQKPEIAQIKFLAEKDGTRILQVTGNLIGLGSFEGNTLTEFHKFRITFAINPNKNLSENKLYPFIIADFNINELEAA